MNKTKEDIEKQTDLTETERALNTGIEIETKRLGVLRVRELSFEKLVIFGRDAAAVFENLDVTETDMEGVGWILKALADPTAQHVMREGMAAASGRPADDFKELGLSDWLLMISALKKVHDWEEIKSLFSQLAPTSMAQATASSVPEKKKPAARRGRRKR